MEILRIIEKNIIDITNNTNEIDSDEFKSNIKKYFEYKNDKDRILELKKEKYYENYENKRVVQNIEYDNYLSDKLQLREIMKSEKTKTALHNYLKLRPLKFNDIKELYSYENINVNEPLTKVPTKKADNGLNYKPEAAAIKPVKVCPEGKEVNPKTGLCVKKCKEDQIRDLETGKCKKNKNYKKPQQEVKEEVKEEVDKCTDAKKKECDDKGKKCNPKTGRCIKK